MSSRLVHGRFFLLCVLLAAAGGAAPPPARGQAHARTPQVAASVVPEARSIRPGSPLRVAIRLAIAPGWHLYWTNPGESGIPTDVRWMAPAGFAAGPIQWPYPKRMELAGVVVHAYEGEVVLLGEILPPRDLVPGKPVEISARIRWGVCREVCIPQETRLSFSLPVEDRPARPSAPWMRMAAAASLRMPQPVPGWTLRAELEQGELVLRVTHPEEGRLPRGLITFFPADPVVLAVAVSVIPRRVGKELILRMERPGSVPQDPVPARLQGVLVAPSGWDAVGRIRALRVDVPIRGQPFEVRHGTYQRRRRLSQGHLDAPAERGPYLGSLDLYPGAHVEVVERASFEGPISLTVNGESRVLSRELADQIHITPVMDQRVDPVASPVSLDESV
jgi:DsbC/DsbD-like thiol-disulfide interchange protein